MLTPRLRIIAMYLTAAAAVLAVGLLRPRQTRTTVPAAAGAPASAEAQLLARMEAEGVDVRQPTTVTFVLYFPAEDLAKGAAAALAQAGWGAPTLERPEAVGGDWQLTVARSMVPTLAGLDSVERTLRPVARRFRGEYDGWDADVVR